MILRRKFIKKSSLAITGPALLSGSSFLAKDIYKYEDDNVDTIARKLIEVGLNKANDLGSQFTDVRLMYSRELEIGKKEVGILPGEYLSVGIRALYNGYWGYASSPIWSEKQIVSLADLAFQQAKGNSQGPGRDIDVSQFTKKGESGTWVMPVKHDPFDRNPYEFVDWISSI